MKPINLSLRSDYSSSSPRGETPDTRYIRLNIIDNDHDGNMSAGDTFVVKEENLRDGEFWRDEYKLNSTDISSPENFRRLIEDAFSKNHVNRRVTLSMDTTGIKDVLLFIAPPVQIADDPEIEATFDLSDGKTKAYN